MISGDHLQVTFPQEITLPAQIICQPGANLNSITCLRNNNTIDFTLVFQNGGIQSNSNFSFILQNVKNPASTKPSSPFTSISTFDNLGNAISIYTSTPVTVQNSIPLSIFGSSIGSSTIIPGNNVTYTLTLTVQSSIPPNGALILTYPDNLTLLTPLGTCKV